MINPPLPTIMPTTVELSHGAVLFKKGVSMNYRFKAVDIETKEEVEFSLYDLIFGVLPPPLHEEMKIELQPEGHINSIEI